MLQSFIWFESLGILGETADYWHLVKNFQL